MRLNIGLVQVRKQTEISRSDRKFPGMMVNMSFVILLTKSELEREFTVFTVRIRNGLNKFSDLLLLLKSRGLPLGAKARLYSACERSVLLL